MSNETDNAEDSVEIVVPGGSFLEQGIENYAAAVQKSVEQALNNYAIDMATTLNVVSPKAKFHGRIGGTNSSLTRATCKSLMAGLVRKVRKEMPFIGANVLGIHEGHLASNAYRIFMLLDAKPSTTRYLDRMESLIERHKLPLRISRRISPASTINNSNFKRVREEAGVADDDGVTGVFIDLQNVEQYIDHMIVAGENGGLVFNGDEYTDSRQRGQVDGLRTSAKNIGIAAPHLYNYLPHVCQAMSTITRRLLCFHSANL